MQMPDGANNFYNSNRHIMRKMLLMLKKLSIPNINHEFGDIDPYMIKYAKDMSNLHDIRRI
jgi:hypothetical protein